MSSPASIAASLFAAIRTSGAGQSNAFNAALVDANGDGIPDCVDLDCDGTGDLCR
jgi:hypothetical protein